MGFFSRNSQENYQWAKKILSKWAPDHRFRWEIYFSLLKENLNTSRYWLDAGSGENLTVEQYQALEFQIGADTRRPLANRANFVRARLEMLPFKKDSFDFISSRYVLEHLETPKNVWKEWQRVLRPRGRVLVQTPNILSYISFIPRLLSFRVKRFLLIRLYRISPKDIFRTYHRFNRPGKFKKMEGFAVEKLILSEDMHLHFRPLFFLSYFVHILTRFGPLGNFRSTITAVVKKTCPEKSRRNV